MAALSPESRVGAAGRVLERPDHIMVVRAQGVDNRPWGVFISMDTHDASQTLSG